MPSRNKRKGTGMSSLQTTITYGKPLNTRSRERMQHSEGTTASRSIPSNSAAAIHIDGGPGGDYASNAWMHAFEDMAIGPINRVQRV
ncbi:transposon I factor [Penicillium verrucosum]|uniref:transposon I factor n=1 Tax=Penicillium verrucosum TaxID=60171 RepID=UPI002544FE2A|nr:transposon I factor [Penicillium verrucosum]KAJ5932854.1 transposon I factor [Penicillium verrucosum]